MAAWLDELRPQAGVVYCKPPFAGPEHVLAYLGRYTHRVALSNNRLVAVAEDRVRFRWRDYADGNRVKVMALDVNEFLRRFLLHVVPAGFVRIRHFGLLANRRRAAALAQCRALWTLPPCRPPRPRPTLCARQDRSPERLTHVVEHSITTRAHATGRWSLTPRPAPTTYRSRS